jgi:hypothetical protein
MARACVSSRLARYFLQTPLRDPGHHTAAQRLWNQAAGAGTSCLGQHGHLASTSLPFLIGELLHVCFSRARASRVVSNSGPQHVRTASYVSEPIAPSKQVLEES